jgi:hypothetical protein
MPRATSNAEEEDFMLRALSRSARLCAVPALVAMLGCAGEGTDVRAPRHPRTEYVVVEPATGPVSEPVVVAPNPATTAVVTVVPAPVIQDASIENWATRYPEAAKGLGAWVHDNPDAAKLVFEFDGRRPERDRELILWAIYHPGEDVMVFAANHPGWEWFDNVMAKHRAGADQFLAWTRHNPIAAEELIGHPSGLLWAGQHLYAAEWREH